MKTLWFRLFWTVSVFLLMVSGPVWAEAPSGSAAVDLATPQWVGHDFLFLGLPADKQPEGYEIFTEDQADRGGQQDRSVRIPYAAHFSRTVTVTRVVPTGDAQFDYLVYMTEKETDAKLVGRTVRGQLEGLGLIQDRENARRNFVGKTIYAKRRTLEGVYDQLPDYKPSSVTVPFGEPMTVIDVWDGIQSSEPIWLVVMVQGQKAALPIAYSWTNQPTNAWTLGHPWEQAFSIDDPKIIAGGNQDIWSLIEAGGVKEGMTRAQVLLSWGSPVRIDENAGEPGTTLWTYGNTRLQFSGDILKAIVSLEPANSGVGQQNP